MPRFILILLSILLPIQTLVAQGWETPIHPDEYKVVFMDNNDHWHKAPKEIAEFWNARSCSLGVWKGNRNLKMVRIDARSLTQEGTVRVRTGSYNAIYPEWISITVNLETQEILFHPIHSIARITPYTTLPYSQSITLPIHLIQPGFKLETSFLIQMGHAIEGRKGQERHIFECR